MQNSIIDQHVEDAIVLIKNTGPECLSSIVRPFQITDINSYNDAMYFWSKVAKYLYQEKPKAKFHFFEFFGISETAFNPYKYKTSWDAFDQSPLLSLIGSQISGTVYGWDESKVFICFLIEMKTSYFTVFKNETTRGFAQDDEEIRSIISYDIINEKGLFQVKIPFPMLFKIGVEL